MIFLEYILLAGLHGLQLLSNDFDSGIFAALRDWLGVAGTAFT